jgi:hypothetical protein
MISRRALLGTLGGGLLIAPLAAEGQPKGNTYRIACVAIAPRAPAEVAELPVEGA